MHGRFATKTNKAPLVSRKNLIENPDFDYTRICLPPSTYLQEKHKIEKLSLIHISEPTRPY